jgi:hypothetical protein
MRMRELRRGGDLYEPRSGKDLACQLVIPLRCTISDLGASILRAA